MKNPSGLGILRSTL